MSPALSIVVTSWLRSPEIVCRSAFDLGTSESVRSVASKTSASAMVWRTEFGMASRPSSPMPMTWILLGKVSGIGCQGFDAVHWSIYQTGGRGGIGDCKSQLKSVTMLIVSENRVDNCNGD